MLLLPKVAKDQSISLIKKVSKIVMTVLATATIAGTASASIPVIQDEAVSPMLMMPSSAEGQIAPWHSSHASHASHASHMSHMSHYSGRY